MPEDAFIAGTEMGVRMFERAQDLRQRKVENERAGRRLALDEEQDKRRIALEERQEDRARRRIVIDESQEERAKLDDEVEHRRKEKAVEDLDYGVRLKKEEMKRYMTADQAWNDYQKAMETVEWGSPSAPEQYKSITQSYLGKITLHDGVRKQWEAFDKVTQQNAEFQAYNYAKQAQTAAQHEASRIAPWLLYDPPKNPDGTINAKEFSRQLKDAKREQIEESIRLRRAYYGGGAGTRATTEPAGVRADRALLNKVREQLMDLSSKGARDPSSGKSTQLADQYRRLQDEERRITERINAGLKLHKESPGSGGPPEEDPGETRVPRQPEYDPDNPLGLGADVEDPGLDEVEAGIGG